MTQQHPYTVMTVCTGNICRSPMAEIILRASSPGALRTGAHRKPSGAIMTQQHPYTVMTVCTGNICRSPMAEIILRAEFESRGIGEDRVRVLSSGVSDEEYGHPIDPRAVRVLRADGYEIPTHHFAHRVTREEIEETDLFL